MKFKILLIAIISLWAINTQASIYAIEKKYIRFSENIQEQKATFKNQGIPLKTQRLSNDEGIIVLSFDKSLPDSLQIALSAAKKLWESKLPCKQPIYISVLFEPLENNISMVADVAYCETDNLLGCPCALASQISDFPYGSSDSPDGYIIFNSDINWNCNFSKESTSEYNLPTMTLRGIARCLGFGSSVTEENKDKFFFFFGWPTYFDKLLCYNGTTLPDVNESSAKMAEFVTSNEVYAKTESKKHKIYAPKQYVSDISLRYFDDTTSLMSYSFSQGNINLSIDDKTSDILRSIGWNLPLSGLKIKCNDISDNGIGSSYSSHTFSLIKGNEIVSNYNWRFFLKNKLGNYTQISSSNTEDFTIAQISSPQDYFININGDLEGRIECDYTLNGTRYSANSFALSLELKPTILSIDDFSIVNNDRYEFSLLFNVHYTGADYISVEIEEEYNTTLRNYRFDEPYIAHVKTGNISNLYYSWVTIIVSNKYGTTYETLEYAPIFRSRSISRSNIQPSDIPLNAIVRKVQLYNIGGSIIFDGTQDEFFNQLFKSGIYLKKEIFDNGFTKASKILIP